MKIKILKIYELNGLLRVETECKYGRDNLGLSLESKFIDPETEEPRYMAEIKNLLTQKYRTQPKKKNIDTKRWNKEIDI